MLVGWGLDGRPEIQMSLKRDTAKAMHNSRNRLDLNAPYITKLLVQANQPTKQATAPNVRDDDQFTASF
jgi:hypothetical protein